VFFSAAILDVVQEVMVEKENWEDDWFWGSAEKAQQQGENYKRKTLHKKEWQLLQEHFGDDVVVLEQCAGEEVHVSPGWPHSVITQAPSVKVAWEVVDPRRLLQYAANLCRIGSRFVDGANNADYAKPLRLLQHMFEYVSGD
jgi:hypothetical protein